MDSLTRLIESEIKRQYKNVRQFSKISGIPYSTLSNALSKGIGGTSFDTVNKICKLLNLKQVYDSDITIFNDQFFEMCSMLETLDDHAVHTVKTVLKVEYDRCSSSKAPKRKRFNGLIAKGKLLNIGTEADEDSPAD